MTGEWRAGELRHRGTSQNLLVVEMVEVGNCSWSGLSGLLSPVLVESSSPLTPSLCSEAPPAPEGDSRFVCGCAVVVVEDEAGFAVVEVVVVVVVVVVDVVVFLVVLVMSHGGGRSVVVVVEDVVDCGRSSMGVPFTMFSMFMPLSSTAPPGPITPPFLPPPASLSPASLSSLASVPPRPGPAPPPAPDAPPFAGGEGKGGSSSVMELTVAMNQGGRGRAVCEGGFTAGQKHGR